MQALEAADSVANRSPYGDGQTGERYFEGRVYFVYFVVDVNSCG
jgi:hypothetical protein